MPTSVKIVRGLHTITATYIDGFGTQWKKNKTKQTGNFNVDEIKHTIPAAVI
jgi:hypothetical protein